MLTVIDTPLVGSNPHIRNGRSAWGCSLARVRRPVTVARHGGDRSLGVPSVQCPNLFEKFSEQLVVTPKNMEIFL
eukprot:COSAG05_NODE_6316_length_981_cov_2.736961_1_plen_74_part_10